MILDNCRGSIIAGTRVRASIWVSLSVVMLAAVGALILSSLPEFLISGDVIWFEVVIFSLLVALYWVLAATTASVDPTRIAFRSALVIWMFLLVSEELFNRSEGDLQSAMQGQFSIAAYGELGLWIVSFLVLLVISPRSPGYLRRMFSAQYQWVSVLTILCMLSTARSPRPLYSMVWGFKLCLVVLLLAMCCTLIRDSRDLMALLRATLWACLFYLFEEVYLGFADPSRAFEAGRFGQSTNSLSVIAGAVLILSLTLGPLIGSIWSFIFSILASTIMILSGGKAGILSGAASATVFYLTKRKVGSAVALLIGMVCLGAALSMVTPLGSYFDTYANGGGADTLTGRTDLWVAVLPLIRQQVVLGHGYMASRFATPQLDWRPGFHWEANHIHNAYLDTLYNNGLVGLGLVLILHAIIIKNLLYVIKYSVARRELYDVSVGSLALYTNLAISAFFNSTIGGRPSTLFMLFLALFVVSESLARELTKTASACRPNHVPCLSDPSTLDTD